MFEQNLIKEKTWNSGIVQFLQNDKVIEQASYLLETATKIVRIHYYLLLNDGQVEAW